MPELPEVEIVKQSLDKKITNNRTIRPTEACIVFDNDERILPMCQNIHYFKY